MKNYPRIYSLSTLGLIHHQEFDYQFHPFRTDFVGESGAGKSMIADLLQLIFVGSDAFESATKATGERKPAGMVLEDSGKGKSNSIGYAFLNIETGPQQYLVIGVGIESGNRNTHNFIIQAGFNYEPITYLTVPLTYHDLLNGDEILPIDLLKNHISEKGLFCESWQKPKKYHEILFKEDILPLDLAANDRLLKDYASILQSFSRGKTLDTQKGSSIKDFLFGRDKAIEIYDKFKQAVVEMEATIGEYGNNLKEIERVTQKQKSLIDLKQKKEELEKLERQYFYTSMAFHHREAASYLQQLEKTFHDFKIAEHESGLISTAIETAINAAAGELPVLQQTVTQLDDRMITLAPENRNVETIESLLLHLTCNADELEGLYQENQRNVTVKGILQTAISALNKKGLLDVFEGIASGCTNSRQLLDHLDEEIGIKSDDLNEKNLLKKYIDIDSPDSLTNWAFLQKRGFSKEEESVILKFQELPRNKPPHHKDYLPHPEELFSQLQIAERDDDGFWLNLSGVRKYIPYVKEQLLMTYEPEKIRSYFAGVSLTTNQYISELTTAVGRLKELKEVWLSFENANAILNAYQNRQSIADFKPITELMMSRQDFEESMACYRRKDQIKKDFNSLDDQKTNASNKLIAHKTLQSQLQDASNQLTLLQSRMDHVIMSTSIASYTPKTEVVTRSIDTTFDLVVIKEQLRQMEISVRQVDKWGDQQAALQSAEAEWDKISAQFALKYPETVWVAEPDATVTDPRGVTEAYHKAEQTYILTYNNIISLYIPSEAFKLQDDDNFFALSKSLLPEAFAELVTSDAESNVIETVQRYLLRINEKNRQLNNRKIQKIKDLLDEVDNTITAQMEIVRRIDNFLKTGHNITGGYHARLKRNFAGGYPKEWMDNFKQKVEQEIGLFAPPDGLTANLANKVSLPEMMLAAFYFCGGVKSQEMTINKLLDPAMYYDLNFTMESSSGRINKGSTGQTYAAIALLCIARLSVMSRDEGKNFGKAVRVMPIDEAEGLGSNYDMLYEIANEYDYQIISLSINPVGKFREGDQYIYMLHKNMEVEAPVNYRPMAIFFDKDIQ